jgi:hypothetical protein
MRKWGVVTLVLLLAFIVLPVSSFGSPALYWNEGVVDELAFAFEPVMLVDLGDDFVFNAAYVKIETTGREVVAIDQSLMYYYFGEYNSGTISVWGQMPKFNKKGNPKTPCDFTIPMNSASLIEQFQLDGPLTTDPFHVKAPDDTSLIFRARLAPDGFGIINFMLIIQEGIVTFAGTI